MIFLNRRNFDAIKPKNWNCICLENVINETNENYVMFVVYSAPNNSGTLILHYPILYTIQYYKKTFREI